MRTIYDFISPNLKPGFELYVDLENLSAGNGGTIPPDILVTNQRPDLVLVNRQSRKIVLFELTVPWDSNVDTSHDLKVRKGKHLGLGTFPQWFMLGISIELFFHKFQRQDVGI